MKNSLNRTSATTPSFHDEKKKILVMTGALVVLLSFFVFNLMSNKGNNTDTSAPAKQANTHRFKLPELRRNELDTIVNDKNEAGRSSLEAGAIDLALDDAAKLAAPQYDAMNISVLDGGVLEELEADPSVARLRPLRMRGFILSLRTRTRANGANYQVGSIVLDDGTAAHFAVAKLAGEGLNVGSSVRIDGLFVKLLRQESDGVWYEGPLVVGREMMRSFPPLYTAGNDHGPFTEKDLAQIQNDDIDLGVGTLPFEQKWKLMARASLLEPDEINWDDVPILNADTLSHMLRNGKEWQGKPIRLPLDGAALLTSTTRPAGENPARIDVYSEGWLADNSWINLAPAIEFLTPFGVDIPDEEDPTVIAHGFVFKNLAYRSSDTGVRLTPVLVLSKLRLLAPPDEYVYGYIITGVAGISLILGVGIFVLLRRDKRDSQDFQQKRRDRARVRRNAANAS